MKNTAEDMNEIEENFRKLKESNSLLEERLEAVNQKLLKSEKLKSDFLSNIKNEINNPLTSILGLLNQVIARPEDAKQTATNTGLIYSEIYALNFQMKNIFNAAEIEAGQAYPQLSNLNLKHLILDLVESFKPMFSKKDIEFEFEFNSSESFVSDREKLEIILSNLIANAIKFSEIDSKIIIRAQMDEQGHLCIGVKDFGVGIPDENLGQIYDRFKQLDSGTRKGFGGHGLGLSIVHSLVDILDGDLKMESAVNEGSYFEVSFPINVSKDFVDPDDEVLFDGGEQEGEVF